MTDSTTRIKVSEATSAEIRPSPRGQLRLVPIDGSVDRTPVALEIDLDRDDGVLILGDLRCAAETQHELGNFEAAHRLWAVVGEAAGRIGHDALVARSIAMGDGALAELRMSSTMPRSGSGRNASGGRRGVSYDYVSLAADRTGGLTLRETAAKWGCSQGTVSRAVSYVAIGKELVAASPELAGKIHSGASVNDLAASYEIETKVMRWIVSDYWDRRT